MDRKDVYGPFSAGASPFRTKGNVYHSLFEAFDKRVPGGASAVFARLEDRDVKAFVEQRFLAASMYDFLPLLELSMISARLAGRGWREFVREGASFTAARDLNGIYKVMLKLATPRMVVERLPRILIRYFDFGRVEGAVSPSRPTRYEAAVHDIPKPVWPWLSAVAEGFIPLVMANAGAKDATVIMYPPTSSGVRGGMDLLTGVFSVTW